MTEIIFFVFLAKYCNPGTKIAIIKIRHKAHTLLLNSIPKINDVGGTLVKIDILYVGATIKHCFIFIKVMNFISTA